MAKLKPRFGIATVLTAVFGSLALFSTGILFFFSLNETLEATRNSLGNRLEALIDEAEQKSFNFFIPVQQQAQWLATEIVDGNINPENSLKFAQILNGALSALPQVSAVSFQKPDGTGVFYDAYEQKLHSVEWQQSWRVPLNRSETNPQTRPPADGVWVLRPSVLDGDTKSTFIVPARTSTGDIGVVAIRLELSSLSDLFATDSTFRGHELVRFILFDDNTVVAHPELKGMEELGRPTVNDLKDPYLKQLSSSERQELRLVRDIEGIETFGIPEAEGLRVFAVKNDVSRQSGGNILIGVHFDSGTASVEVRRFFTLIGVGIGLLIVSMVGAFLLGRWAAGPIRQLSAAAQLVQDNKLNDIKPLPNSRIVELSSALNAFNGMVDGLKERERIRDLFGKYVPQDVANLLVTDDQIAEPTDATATVLFLDLVGFSSISETLSPKELVDTMNSFFSEAVEIIESEQGIVTQFQGDAILAVFNVPIKNEDHANAAIRAAIAITKMLDGDTFAGQQLDCRIGINTGPLVAGAIGAEDRLSYTVYGDAVNVASRLETMNKEYGTRILISEESVKQSNGFDFDEVGTLPVRGRKKDVKTYVLSG